MSKEKLSNYARNRSPIAIESEAINQPSKDKPISISDHQFNIESLLSTDTSAARTPVQYQSQFDDEIFPKDLKPNEMFSAWRQLIENQGPFSYMFTLSFHHCYTDEQAIRSLYFWCKKLNDELKGNRWKKRGTGIRGVIVAEQHKVSGDFRGRLHFHLLLRAADIDVDTDVLRHTCFSIGLDLRDHLDRPMTEPDRMDLTELTEERGVTGYLLKSIFTEHWSNGDNISFMNADSRPDDFPFTKRTARQLSMAH
jgi:hypothetical protein